MLDKSESIYSIILAETELTISIGKPHLLGRQLAGYLCSSESTRSMAIRIERTLDFDDGKSE